jgi:hypothetical protein
MDARSDHPRTPRQPAKNLQIAQARQRFETLQASKFTSRRRHCQSRPRVNQRQPFRGVYRFSLSDRSESGVLHHAVPHGRAAKRATSDPRWSVRANGF